jgi:ornithine cyclodeaminase/alanine dehydrogenase-like protein (mu-crystallin family)
MEELTMGKQEEWKTRILTTSDLKKVWDMKKSLQAVEDSLRFIGEEKLFQEKCKVLNPSEGNFSFILPHPAWIQPWKVVGDKWLGCCDGNPKKGLPYKVVTKTINDADTLMPIAFMDAAYLTGMRTAAMAAIGAKYLARKDSSTLTIVGCGVQGRTHLSSMSELKMFPLKRVQVFDLNEEAMRSFKEYGESNFNVEVIPMASVAEAVKGADIVCMLTTCRTPLVTDDMIAPGTHLCPTCLWDVDMRNIFRNVDKWVLGNTDSDRNWFENPAAIEKYDLRMEMVYANLSDLVCGKKPGRERAEERTTMTHLGMGANDVAVAYQAYKAALEAGVGIDVQIMS